MLRRAKFSLVHNEISVDCLKRNPLIKSNRNGTCHQEFFICKERHIYDIIMIMCVCVCVHVYVESKLYFNQQRRFSWIFEWTPSYWKAPCALIISSHQQFSSIFSVLNQQLPESITDSAETYKTKIICTCYLKQYVNIRHSSAQYNSRICTTR
jgi:hypothetical protein